MCAHTQTHTQAKTHAFDRPLNSWSPGLTHDLAIHRRRYTGQCSFKLKECVPDPQVRVNVLMQESGGPRVNVVIADEADDESISPPCEQKDQTVGNHSDHSAAVTRVWHQDSVPGNEPPSHPLRQTRRSARSGSGTQSELQSGHVHCDSDPRKDGLHRELGVLAFFSSRKCANAISVYPSKY